MGERSSATCSPGRTGLTERANTFDEGAVLREFAAAAGAGRARRRRCAAQADGSPARDDVLATARAR